MKKRILLAIIFALSLVSSSFAQYSQIPDEPDGAGCPNVVSQCSGYKVRADINARFGGQSPISPFIETLAYNPVVLTFATQRNYQAGDTYVDFDATSGNISYTLPAWTLGLQLEFKRVDSTSHSVTILANGSNTIDGAASVTLVAKQPITIGAGMGIAGNWDVLHAQVGSANTNGAFNVATNGAKCDGATDDAAAFQTTINAACALQMTVGPASISPTITVPNGNCVLAKPLVFSCGTNSNAALNTLTMNGSGYLTTTLSPTNLGPAIMPVASNQISQLGSSAGVITASPLVGSTGNSLLWSGSTSQKKQWYVDLTEVLTSLNTNTSTPSPYLNGATAATMRGFFEPTTSGVTEVISCSAGSLDYGANIVVDVSGTLAAIYGGALCVWVDTDNKLHGFATTSVTGFVEAKSAATVTLSGVNEYDVEYDGAHLGVALNGAWGSLTAATGTLVQRSDEMTFIGALPQEWPHGTAFYNWFGEIYDPEIGNTNRRTLGTNYTQDTAAFTGDSHSIYLSTFARTIDMTGTSHVGLVGAWQPVLFGADYFNGAAATNVWASVHAIGLGCCGGSYNLNNFTINGGGIGIDDLNATLSAEHVQTNSQTVMGVDITPNGTFGSRVTDMMGINDRMGHLVLEGGITAANKVDTGACGVVCDFSAGGSFNDSYIAAQADTLWGLVLAGQTAVSNLTDDAETGGNCAGLIIELGNGQSPSSPSVISNSNITSCGGTNISPVEIENVNAGAGEPFIGDSFNWGGTPTAVVHQVGSISGRGSIPIFEGCTFGAGQPNAPIPYTDGGIPYQVIGAATSVPTTLNGTSVGTAVWSEPVQGGNAKTVTVNLIGYENTTGTAQTITYPLPFATVVSSVQTDSGSCSGVTASLTTLTLPASMGATQTGLCEVRGY